MTDFNVPSDKREFRCDYCNGRILIPINLPPTTGPCPHCTATITSPPPESPAPAPFPIPAAPVAAAPVQVMPPAPAVSVPVVPAEKPPEPTPAMPPVPPVAVAPSPAVTTGPLPAIAPAPVQASAPPVSPAVPVMTEPEPKAAAPEPQPPAEKPPVSRPEEPTSGIPARISPPRQAALVEPPPTPKERAAKEVEIPRSETPAHTNHRRKPHADPKPEAAAKNSLMPVLIVLWLVILGAGAAVYFFTKEMGRNPAPPTVANSESENAAREANYIRVGWKKDAYQVLHDYMAATSAEEKLPHILNADSLSQRIEDFYGGGVINDSDTPAEAFSVYELSEEDRRRGLFMMVYDQPPQFDMKEFFRPLASLEVQYGIDEADLLLSTLARVGNFAMEPLRVHAFFKRTPQGLKLDWETFAQTKYRTLQSFLELPEAGVSGVFRVFIVEDVPDKNRLEMGTRTYRVADPANTTDTARVNVKVDSEIGRTLSIINWRGTKEARPITRTATMELQWTGDPATPTLEIGRFICWEFLGLGGDTQAPTAAIK